MEQFTNTNLAVIHDKLEAQDELLDKMPTKEEIETIQAKLSKLLEKLPTRNELEERFDALEQLVLSVVENVKERKLKSSFQIYHEMI